jgi:peroxiredoxin family protein
MIFRTMPKESPVSAPSEPLGILLISGTHERAHYAFVLAAGAAALGHPTTVFATNAGCRALLADWSLLSGAEREHELTSRGIAGFEALREAARELGVRLLVCEAGMVAEGLEKAALWPGVEVAGVASFLAASKGGQIISL